MSWIQPLLISYLSPGRLIPLRSTLQPDIPKLSTSLLSTRTAKQAIYAQTLCTESPHDEQHLFSRSPLFFLPMHHIPLFVFYFLTCACCYTFHIFHYLHTASRKAALTLNPPEPFGEYSKLCFFRRIFFGGGCGYHRGVG